MNGAIYREPVSYTHLDVYKRQDVDFGLSDSNFDEAVIKRLAAQAARMTVLASDHSKFGKTALSRVFDLDEADYIVTDNGLDSGMEKSINQITNLILV